MDLDENDKVVFLTEKLEQALVYSEALLREYAPHPHSLRKKAAYMSAALPLALSHGRGTLTLADSNQVRSAIILLRSLQELWMNIQFIYSVRSNVFLWQMVIEGEQSNIKRMKDIPLDGEHIRIKEREYNKTLNDAKKHYNSLPCVKGVIAEGSEIGRRMTLLDRCKVVDILKGVNQDEAFSMVRGYNMVYGYLSEYVHSGTRGLNTIYAQDDESIAMDIYKRSNKTTRTTVLSSAYIYFFDIMRLYHIKVLNRRRVDANILASYREVFAFLSKNTESSI